MRQIPAVQSNAALASSRISPPAASALIATISILEDFPSELKDFSFNLQGRLGVVVPFILPRDTPIPLNSLACLRLCRVKNEALVTQSSMIHVCRVLTIKDCCRHIKFLGTTIHAFKRFMDNEAYRQMSQHCWSIFQGVIICRTYRSTCVTHPNGDVHTIGRLLPLSLPLRVTIENDKDSWMFYDTIVPDVAKKLCVLNMGNKGKMNINGCVYAV